MSLFYRVETNEYAQNNTDADAVLYARGGWLDHIDYGTDNRSGTDTENTSAPAPCASPSPPPTGALSSCATRDAAHWPDTPWDLQCSAAPCPRLHWRTE
jgi:hypothetical protein